MPDVFVNCFIIDIHTGEKFEFQLPPENFRTMVTSGVSRVSFAGLDVARVNPRGVGNHDLSFDVSFVAEDEFVYNAVYVAEQVAWLESLAAKVAIQQSPRVMATVPALLVIGELFELPLYIESVDTRWGPFMDPRSMMPLIAQCSVKWIAAPIQAVITADRVRGDRGNRVRSLVWEFS